MVIESYLHDDNYDDDIGCTGEFWVTIDFSDAMCDLRRDVPKNDPSDKRKFIEEILSKSHEKLPHF